MSHEHYVEFGVYVCIEEFGKLLFVMRNLGIWEFGCTLFIFSSKLGSACIICWWEEGEPGRGTLAKNGDMDKGPVCMSYGRECPCL